MDSPIEPERQSIPARVRHNVRNRIVSGLLVLIPLGVTVFILNFLYSMTVSIIEPMVSALPGHSEMPGYAITIISVVLLVALLYIVGVIATNIVGRQLIELGESVLARIPLVKTIYAVSKQVVDAFSPRGKASTFRAVGLIDFPGKGMRSLAFVTGSLQDESGRLCHRLFVPQTPNPTMGFLVIVPASDVTITDMTVEEACKAIMSGGIIAPDRLAMRTESPAVDPDEAS